jgi:hypothetical protein
MSYFELAKIGIVIAVALIITFFVHKFLSYEQQIGYDKAKAEYNERLVEAQKAAINRENELKQQLKEALNGQSQRDEVIRKLSVAASGASSSLRDTLTAIRDGSASAAIDALRKTTVTLTTVFGECADRYRDMAEKADRHASDVKTLVEAWPK